MPLAFIFNCHTDNVETQNFLQRAKKGFDTYRGKGFGSQNS